jgi:RNase P subunit RPR2
LESTYCPKCNSKLIERNFYGVNILGLEKTGNLSVRAKCVECGEKIEGVFE